MKVRRREGALLLGAVLLSAFPVSCDGPAGGVIPQVICGTRVDPALTRPLVTSTNDLDEYNRVDRSEAITAPCLLLSDDAVVLRFRFSWDTYEENPLDLARSSGSVSSVTQPRTIDSPYKTVIGTDGAISTTPCKTPGGKYFTLTLQLPQVKLTDRSHRQDIEKFMRAYFPATVGTLGCGEREGPSA